MVRRAQKLPIVSGPGKIDLTIHEAEWQRIERAYGHKLSSSVRSDVLGATKMYILLDILERQAEPAADAEKIIGACKKAAGNLYSALRARPSSDAASCARDLIRENFHDARLCNDKQFFSALSGLLTSFERACDLSLAELLRELNDPTTASFQGGECRKYWIPRLTEIMKQAGLPTGVRKDTDKRKSVGPSLFVALVRELQKCLPDGCCRTTHSDDALAEAIVRARTFGSQKALTPTLNKTRNPSP